MTRVDICAVNDGYRYIKDRSAVKVGLERNSRYSRVSWKVEGNPGLGLGGSTKVAVAAEAKTHNQKRPWKFMDAHSDCGSQRRITESSLFECVL